MVNWELSERVKPVIIQETQNDRSQVFVSQIYSKSLTFRRNEVLKHRYDMRKEEPSMQAYIRYPANLMVKRPGEKKYNIEKEF